MLDPVGAARTGATPNLPADGAGAAQKLLADARTASGIDVARLAAGYGALRRANPGLADSVRPRLDAALTPAQQGQLAARAEVPAATPVSAGSVALDVGQVALDIAGIFDPTPISDGSNAVISLFRGDWSGAGLSAIGIVPYIGDAAKLGKLGKWAKTVENAVEVAKTNVGLARKLEPALGKIAEAIRAAPIDKLPVGARKTLEEMAAKIEGHLAMSHRAADAARDSGIPEAKVREILATPKGSRPPASDYLSDKAIAQHLKPFEETGAVRFTSHSGLADRGTLGPPNGTFTIPRSELDRVIKETGGDFAKIEQKLGLDAGTLSNGDTLIAYIKPENLNNLRMPSGNELGANTYWVPGGRTSGGVPEATIDVPAGTKFTPLTLKP